jgi:hypothetical protein
MVQSNRGFATAIATALMGLFVTTAPAMSADLGPQPRAPLAEPSPPPNPWQLSFTPYGWMLNVNGNVIARGHTVDVNDSFFEIVEKSDSLLAWMSYFEARKGPFSLFTDVVWADLGFPGHAQDDFNRQASGHPFERFPAVGVSVDGNLHIKGHAQLDYQSVIVQSGAGLEVAHWSGPSSRTGLELLAGARYWNQNVDTSVSLKGNFTADVAASATFEPRDVLKQILRDRGFRFNPRRAKLLQHVINERFGPGQDVTLSRTVQVDVSKAVAFAQTGDLEWVDPFVGFRVRHEMGPSKELGLEADFGGFGVGSDFSWQVVGTYGFDTTCLGTPLHAVIGYRALSVDFSENGKFGKNGIDMVQHGPIMGVTFRW